MFSILSKKKFTISVILNFLSVNAYMCVLWQSLTLPNDKLLDCSKLKTFADDKIKVFKMMIFVFNGVENIMGLGENAGNLNVFKKFFTRGRLKLGLSGRVKLGTIQSNHTVFISKKHLAS